MAKNHIPQRTCVACRTTGDKRNFVRLVRTQSGSVEVDPTGKKDGRGAYACTTSECLDRALKGNALGAALRTTISTQDRESIRSHARTLAEQAAVGS